MLLTLMFLNLMFSLIFIMVTHPLTLGLILLIQTLLISLISGNFNYNFWFSYIIFLILVGGMLILFIYMTSVASNEKFTFNMTLLLPIMITPTILILTSSLVSYLSKINLINNEMMEFNMTLSMNSSTIKFMNFPSNIIILFMIIYLLLALVAIVKITNLKHGPLRQMN
uniref:NADH-ubiquinone oxidoreductase chain 6 n=1 Tax=Tenebrionoidea sp. 16 KM-2017 TaxID=2219471 RepID=A0A346RHM1_9CUCU|nr:NADH dehydrogenase subunit 6 [Tenebrionoidea sp. 16 KM-2017]